MATTSGIVNRPGQNGPPESVVRKPRTTPKAAKRPTSLRENRTGGNAAGLVKYEPPVNMQANRKAVGRTAITGVGGKIDTAA